MEKPKNEDMSAAKMALLNISNFITEERPYIESTEAIISQLKNHLDTKGRLLVTNAGDAKQAIELAKAFPKVTWVVSDTKSQFEVMNHALKDLSIRNIEGPVKLKLGVDDFPKTKFDFIYCFFNVTVIFEFDLDGSFGCHVVLFVFYNIYIVINI